MKISGFSFIKNAILYDYPVVEAIQSILPLCDEFVIAVGKSNDDTLQLISQIDPGKIKIIETEWDESLREGGRVLALETNKAFRHISGDSDWAFYIQGDEVLHEKYLDEIHENMLRYKDDKRVDGFLVKYLHFYGSYDYVGDSSKWYKNEIRVIRNDPSIYSYKDAQGFRKGNDEKLNVIPLEAYMYHYGWVKEPVAMQRKQENFHKHWHDDQWVEKNVDKVVEFNYSNHIRSLRRFEGDHPEVMKRRIAAKNWKFDYDISQSNKTMKDIAKEILKKYVGMDTDYRNYKILKK